MNKQNTGYFENLIAVARKMGTDVLIPPDLLESLINKIKEQEPIEPYITKDQDNTTLCGDCFYPIWDEDNYCSYCGRKIKRSNKK
jgi:hypothetical protein